MATALVFAAALVIARFVARLALEMAQRAALRLAPAWALVTVLGLLAGSVASQLPLTGDGAAGDTGFLYPAAVALVGWWRGVGLANRLGEYEATRSSLEWQAAGVLVLSFLVWASGPPTAVTTGVANAVWLFLAGGLLALAAARMTEISTVFSRGEIGLKRSTARSSLLLVGSVVALVTLAGLAVRILPPGWLAAVRAALGWTWQGVARLLTVLLMALAYAVGFLMEPVLNWLHEILLKHGQPLPPAKTLPPGQIPPGPEAAAPWLVTGGKAVLVVGLLALFTLAVVRAMRLRTAPSGDEVEEVRESVWSWSGLLDSLRPRWRTGRLLRALSRRRRSIKALPGGRSEARIRQVYARLLVLGTRLGAPRRVAETPAEYRPVVTSALVRGMEPGETAAEELAPAAVAELTFLYQLARYRDVGLEEATADRAEAAWEAIQQLITVQEARPRRRPR